MSSKTASKISERSQKSLVHPKKNKLLKVIAGAPDKPLVIGPFEIPCYVLEGEVRVLVQRQLQMGVGMSSGGGKDGSRRLAGFLEKLAEKSKTPNGSAIRAAERVRNPIEFYLPGGGIAHGYPASLLVDICDAVLEARKLQILHDRQSHIADRCEILVRGFARIGINALVDEATGYQEQRSKKALADALEMYLGELKEQHPWIKTFPLEFYKEIYRLRRWEWTVRPGGKKPPTPQLVGKFTNQLIYERLIPGFPRALLDELEKVNPVTGSGSRKSRHHQWFTLDKGLPLLHMHIGKVMGIMVSSNDWGDFTRKLKKGLPRIGDQTEMLDE